MRIREIYFNNFRSFRGEHRISFVDPVTDEVRPVTVLSGSNGTGKTTILDAIENLLRFIANPILGEELRKEAKQVGLICLGIELSPHDIALSTDEFEKIFSKKDVATLHVAVGRKDMAPESFQELWPNLVSDFIDEQSEVDISALNLNASDPLLFNVLRKNFDLQTGIWSYGGLIYFPHDRRLSITKGGPIESPPQESKLIFRFAPENRWKGSLEQLWVWQNYLDLEQNTTDRDNMEPFVKLVEDVLGRNRRIRIKEGRVTVPAGWGDNGEAARVRLDQLPSGEQQVLLLFGELARRRRPGVVIAIDEIENSLHPTLQRLVMWNLRKIAREWDAQVIVTTHSAEIINTVRGGAFINLDYPDDQFDLPLPEDDELEAA